MRVRIRHRQTLPEALSASALERVGEYWYVIGDDASVLYQFDDAFQHCRALPLTPARAPSNARSAKNAKFDLEAMTAVEWQGQLELLIFGSGSQTPTRDFCFRADLSNPRAPRIHAPIALTTLYDTLRDSGVARLNLEAAVATLTEIILFQRGNSADNNALIAFDRATFMAYLAEPTRALPQPRITAFALPQLYNRRAGFSAATLLNATQILFAASVEDTPDEIQDGPTLGSFIGLLQAQPEWRMQWVAPVRARDEIAPVKIEGLACEKFTREAQLIYAVTDADGAPSELLRIDCAED